MPKWVKVAAWIAVPVLVVMAMFVAATGFLLWQLHNWKFTSGRDHLEPIPIDLAACPNVVFMHEAARQFEQANLIFGMFDSSGRQVPWSEAKPRLERAATLLVDSITASIQRFPPRVQWYLTITRDNLRSGRVQLDLASDGIDLLNRTYILYGDGKKAFGFAGDLIGDQCSVPLGV